MKRYENRLPNKVTKKIVKFRVDAYTKACLEELTEKGINVSNFIRDLIRKEFNKIDEEAGE